MTDRDLILKKLAFIETCVSDLRRLARPEALSSDIKEQRFVIHTLQLAIQAALDVASHIVSSERLGEPETNRAVFTLLASNGWIPVASTQTLHEMSGFRNLVVHAYQEVDLSVVRNIFDTRLDDLLGYAASVRSKILQEPE